MHRQVITLISMLLISAVFTMLSSCSNTAKEPVAKEDKTTLYASDVISFFDHWNLILGDGSNAGQAIDFEHRDFFYTANDAQGNWVVFKAPNAGIEEDHWEDGYIVLVVIEHQTPNTERRTSK